MWQVAQLALRHENGMGASWSSHRSASEPPSGAATVFLMAPSLDSNVTVGMRAS